MEEIRQTFGPRAVERKIENPKHTQTRQNSWCSETSISIVPMSSELWAKSGLRQLYKCTQMVRGPRTGLREGKEKTRKRDLAEHRDEARADGTKKRCAMTDVLDGA